MNKLSSYVINNDTDKFAVILEDEFQLFDTAEEAERICAEIFKDSGGSGYIADANFNFYEVLNPHTISTGHKEGQKLSEYEPCDLLAFIAQWRAEIQARVDAEPPYDYKGFFGDLLA